MRQQQGPQEDKAEETMQAEALQDLLMLQQGGLPVIWPVGHMPEVARGVAGRLAAYGVDREGSHRPSADPGPAERGHKTASERCSTRDSVLKQEALDATALEDLHMLHAAGVPVVWPKGAAAKSKGAAVLPLWKTAAAPPSRK